MGSILGLGMGWRVLRLGTESLFIISWSLYGLGLIYYSNITSISQGLSILSLINLNILSELYLRFEGKPTAR